MGTRRPGLIPLLTTKYFYSLLLRFSNHYGQTEQLHPLGGVKPSRWQTPGAYRHWVQCKISERQDRGHDSDVGATAGCASRRGI